jgi:hypothetical protein
VIRGHVSLDKKLYSLVSRGEQPFGYPTRVLSADQIGYKESLILSVYIVGEPTVQWKESLSTENDHYSSITVIYKKQKAFIKI